MQYRKTILRNLNFQYSNKVPMEKARFMAPMKNSPGRKVIMPPVEYTLKVCSPNRKGMVL